ncbi:hypothetical protein HWV62_23108 [Athelia sp. TMB]|nr:hypothetical protein HWV62_23108 [Athelia sp. TMB]
MKGTYEQAGIKCDQLPLKKHGSLYVKLIVDGPDGQREDRTAYAEGRSSASWISAYLLTANLLELQVHQRHRIKRDEQLGSVKDTVDNFLKEGTSGITDDTEAEVVIRKLQTVDKHGVARETTAKIMFSITSLSAHSKMDQLQRQEAIGRADHGISSMDLVSPMTESLTNAIITSSGITNAVTSFADTWDSLLETIKPFIEITDKIAEAIIKQRVRDESLCSLMEAIKDVHSFLLEAQPLEFVASHRRTFENMGRLTEECAQFIARCTLDENFWKRVLTQSLSSLDAKILDYESQFREVKKAFQVRSALHTEIAIEDLGNSLFYYNLKLGNNLFSAMKLILDDMPHAKADGYIPEKCCLPGTRIAVLRKIDQWINLPNDETVSRLLILYGVAGCGKSAIAHRVARDIRDQNRLGSAIFFERAAQAQRHSGILFGTVSRNIAHQDTRWRNALCEIIKDDEALRHTPSISMQMENFILKPAKILNGSGPVVIVIDALDESGDVAARTELLRILVANAPKLPSCFRILITTRLESDIWERISSKPLVQLEPIDNIDSAIDADIALFVRYQLSDIADDLERKLPNGKWCSALVGASDHLFQWAATACLAIIEAKGGEDHDEVLLDFVNNIRGLDDLYLAVLAKRFDPNDNNRAMPRFRRVMGNILAAKEPLSMHCHSELWRYCNPDGRNPVELIVGQLGSLLSGTKNKDKPIRALHTSFFDFLKDSRRSGVYYVDPMQQDRHLALACLRVMNAELKFNICRLESSHRRNADILDLPARIQNFISTVLSYSCRFMGEHMALASNDEWAGDDLEPPLFMQEYEEEVRLELLHLFQEKFTYWLEVLSVENHMNITSRSLRAILAISVEKLHDAKLVLLITDAISFVNVFAPPISESAPHVYLSALPFAPASSAIAQQYLPRYPGTLKLSSGRLENWPAALKTMEGHTNGVTSVACSPDGKRIASGSWDNTIRIWDVETGAIVVGPLYALEWVSCVAYSPDGKHIISGHCNGIVGIWDANNGDPVAVPFEAHDGDRVCAVAYSPKDGKHIVSGSVDGTIWIRVAETGETVVGPFRTESENVNCVAYSPDAKFIVYGSVDATIGVCSAASGKQTLGPLKGHSAEVNCVAYSPDGKYVVSGSSDKSIRVWHAQTGEPLESPGSFAGEVLGISCVAFSPDGRHVASGSHGNSVRLWDIKTGGTVAGPFEGHSNEVTSVAFLPGRGKYIVSGSSDGTIRVWNADSTEAALSPFEGHSNGVRHVAYSPDGDHIISHSFDGTIRIWNADTAEPAGGPFRGRNDFKASPVSYSWPDGRHIIIGSEAGAIQVWNAKTSEPMPQLLGGHEQSSVTSLASSPDGRYIAYSCHGDTNVYILGKDGYGPIKELGGHTSDINALDYSPNAQYVASGSNDGTIRVWDVEKGATVFESAQLDGLYYIKSVAYSPNGEHIVSGSGNRKIQVWKVEINETKAKPIKVLSGHDGWVSSVAYSPTGRYIVSGSEDYTVRVWDAQSGDIVAGPFKGHIGWVESVAFSPSGKQIVSGSWDSVIRIWNVENISLSAEVVSKYVLDAQLLKLN